MSSSTQRTAAAPPQGEAAPPGVAARADDTPVAVIVSGRGRVGKTAVANTLVQFCRSRGATLQVWNADRQNETHSLGIFHADALRPPSDDAEDKRLWLEQRFTEQAQKGVDAVLDMAGGDPLVRQLGKGARLVRSLQRLGIRPVSVQVLGPDIADLNYLRYSMEGGLFMPEATVLLLNAGLVRSGRSVRLAFEEVTGSDVFLAALSQGAHVGWFPSLICMTAVADRGLSFAQAMHGETRPGQAPLSFFDQSRVEIFWEDELPAFFSQLPPEWLPRMPEAGR